MIQKIVGKVLKGLELADRKDNKLTLVKLKFSMNGYDKLTEKKIKLLWETAEDFFHLIHGFGQNENITNFVNAWMLEDDTTFTHNNLRTFWNIFYKNLFFPDKDSKLCNYKKLTNDALETLLNKLFSLDQENNKCIINEYIKQRQIQMTWPTLTNLYQSPTLVYLKLVTLERFSFCGKK